LDITGIASSNWVTESLPVDAFLLVHLEPPTIPGWNVPYEWMDGDFQALEMCMSSLR
jgi:hypothetical protein